MHKSIQTIQKIIMKNAVYIFIFNQKKTQAASNASKRKSCHWVRISLKLNAHIKLQSYKIARINIVWLKRFCNQKSVSVEFQN